MSLPPEWFKGLGAKTRDQLVRELDRRVKAGDEEHVLVLTRILWRIGNIDREFKHDGCKSRFAIILDNKDRHCLGCGATIGLGGEDASNEKECGEGEGKGLDTGRGEGESDNSGKGETASKFASSG